jgi:hypothetical protein
LRKTKKLVPTLLLLAVLAVAAIWFWPADGIVTMTMHQKRLDHSMTLLQSGEVLVVGGDKGEGGKITAELFDPVSKNFHGLQEIPAIYSHTAIALNNGNVLLLSEKKVILYDLKANKFTALQGANFTRSFFAPSLLPNGEVFVGEVTSTEGCGSAGQPCLKIATHWQLYNPETNQFRIVDTLTPLPPKDKMLEAYIPNISGKELKILQQTGVLPRIENCRSFAINQLKDENTLFITCGSSEKYAHNKAYLWDSKAHRLTSMGKLRRATMRYSFAELDSGFLLTGGQAPNWFDSDAYLNSAQFIPKLRLFIRTK